MITIQSEILRLYKQYVQEYKELKDNEQALNTLESNMNVLRKVAERNNIKIPNKKEKNDEKIY